jgi:WD40 repeat protein
MHHVFVSYSRTDDPWVEKLIEVLSAKRVRTWQDQSDLPVSVPWMEQIQDAIEESSIVLFCDSPRSRSSDPCAFELATASKLSKPICTVAVGGDEQAAAAAVIDRLGSLDPVLELQTELLVRSRDWDRAGRPRGALVGSRQRRRLSRGLAGGVIASAVETAFLAASQRRSMRLLIVSLLGSGIVGFSILGGLTLQGVQSRYSQINAQQAAIYERTNQALKATKLDPYNGLRLAGRLGNLESAAEADIITGALSDPVPDDAFTVPPGARRFATNPVGRLVMVIGGDGSTWLRAADAVSQRTAKRGSETAPRRSAGAWKARAEDKSGIVRVLHGSKLFRRIALPAPPSALVVSPDGRQLAAGVGTEVKLVELDSGLIRTTLRGAPSDVSDLAWSSDSGRVWAISNRTVVSWSARQGRVLLNEPQRWFQAILRSRRADQAWVVSRDGLLRKVRLDSGDIVKAHRVHDVILSAAGDHNGETAVAIGLDKNWIIELERGKTQTFTLDDCIEGRPALSLTGESIFIPCLQGPVIEVSAANGREIRRLPIPEKGANSVAVTPRTGRLLVGGWGGELLEADRARSSVMILRDNPCHPSVLFVAAAQKENRVLPVGEGTGMVGCTRLGLQNPNGTWTWNAIIHAPPNSILAFVAAFDPTGVALAVGYSDGTLVIRPTENLAPAVVVTSVLGAIRDMFASNETLYVVTRAGILQAVPLCPTCLTNKHLARTAHDKLERAIQLKLTHR